MLLNKLLKKKLLPLHHIMYTTEMLQLKKERKKENYVSFLFLINPFMVFLICLKSKKYITVI